MWQRGTSKSWAAPQTEWLPCEGCCCTSLFLPGLALQHLSLFQAAWEKHMVLFIWTTDMWKESSLQEQENSWKPFNDLALIGKKYIPSLPPWNHPPSDCTQWQRNYIESPGSCTSAHKCWAGKPSPAIQLSLPSSPLCSTCFSTVSFLLDLQSFIWRKGGKELLQILKQDSNQKHPNQKATHIAKFVTHCSQAIQWPWLRLFWLTTDFTHFWSPQLWLYNPQCQPSSTSPTAAGTKPADQLSPISPHTRCLLSLPCRVRPHFLELRQRWNLLHLQAINPFYLPEPSIDGNSCVAVFP